MQLWVNWPKENGQRKGESNKVSCIKIILYLKTWAKEISAHCVQADLPKSENNFVKETFECGKRLAKNKVPQFVSSLMSHSFIIVIIIIITRSSLSSMICRCMSSTPCQQSFSFLELWASELSCQSILNTTSGNQHPVRVKLTF